MSDVVKFRLRDGIGIVTIDNPPLNTLSQAVRQGICDTFERIAARDDVRAVVIVGEGRSFPVGADIREFGAPIMAPGYAHVCNVVEACAVPVIAALHGTALGGGCELALAAHYRVAQKGAVLGLPEVNLGILPGAGGTQRLPRIVGAAPALAMMLSGQSVSVERARELGLVDGIINGHLLTGAVTYCEAILEQGRGVRRTSEMRQGFADMAAYQQEIATRKQTVKGTPLFAPGRIVDCVEAAALLPFGAGLAFEAAGIEDCFAHPQSGALIHAFLAERAGMKPGFEAQPVRKLERVGVVGGMGTASGLAMALIAVGIDATLIAPDPAVLQQVQGAIKAALEQGVSKGDFGDAEKDRRLSHLVLSTDFNALVGADMAIYAGEDTPEAARDGLREIAGRLPEGLPLAVAGFGNGINKLGGEAGRARDIMGIGFSSAAHRVRVVEFRVGQKTSENTQSSALALIKALGKRAIWCGPSPWGVGPRMMAALAGAADRMVAAGTPKADIIAALETMGWRAKRFLERISDDVGEGEKAGADEIKRRLIAALANEGLRLIDLKTARRSSDIDVVMMLGYGFPRWLGGPMHLAQDQGLIGLRTAMKEWAEDDPFWTPVPLWDEAVKTAAGFTNLGD